MRKFWGVPLAAAALFALAACGNAKDGDDGVASLGDKASASASPSVSLDPKDAQLKFAQCMRDNGVKMDDPGGDGGIRIGAKGGDEKKIEAAMKKCGKILEQAGMNREKPDPAMRDKLVKFAQCMREHGIDMPDPTDDGRMTMKVPKGGPSKKEVEKAHKDCEQFLPNMQGGPPRDGGPRTSQNGEQGRS